jgi:hypothetical protein
MYPIELLRGGASTSKSNTQRKKKRKATIASTPDSTKVALRKKRAKSSHSSRPKIEEALKEKDSAKALGDAIRDRADDWRSESPLLESIDQSVRSVGWALGASDQQHILIEQKIALAASFLEDDEGGGVEAAPTSVVMYYFLKSHGGAHALQCVCSVLATVAALGGMALPKGSPLALTLMKRCMLFAMVKHISGLIAASFLTARAIPEVGLRKARLWMEQLAADPVSQYVFYSACILLWLPTNMGATTEWWQEHRMVPALLVGPVLLRELVSSALVISDVLVLWTCSSIGDEGAAATAKRILAFFKSAIDAFMSLLVTPEIWRKADATKKQAILAKLTSKFSLALELAVGLLLMVDVFWGSSRMLFAPQRAPFLPLLRRLVCTRLYLHFLWSRRRRVSKLATSIRGGAAQVPFYVMQVMMDPRSSMGLERSTMTTAGYDSLERSLSDWTWRDYVLLALGLD